MSFWLQITKHNIICHYRIISGCFEKEDEKKKKRKMAFCTRAADKCKQNNAFCRLGDVCSRKTMMKDLLCFFIYFESIMIE